MRFGNALGWTIIHFVWQGTLIAALFAVARVILRRSSANARYLTGCAAMLLMLIVPLLTLAGLSGRTAAGAIRQGKNVADFFPVLISVWLTGVVLLSVWSAGGWVVAQRLRRQSRRLMPEEWQSRVARLCVRVGVARTVRVFQTALTEVPMVVGWIRPVILVPVCAFANLDVPQLEALLAHELAHIRRYDYLVNLVQTAIETLLFYHPAVWWLGSRIRDERENCCDDVAVAVCGSTFVYASALASLEESRVAGIQMAMAASNGSLLKRIRRLTRNPQQSSSGAPGWLIALAVSFGITVMLTGSAPRVAAKQRTAPRGSFVAGIAAAGYAGISVDEIIALKEHNVSPEYILSIVRSAIDKPSPRQLIELHDNGVNEKHIEQARELGLETVPVDRVLQLKQSGFLGERSGK
ncbi:MAG: M56 family metallopeptidase [Bryobacteraceae bacterium]